MLATSCAVCQLTCTAAPAPLAVKEIRSMAVGAPSSSPIPNSSPKVTKVPGLPWLLNSVSIQQSSRTILEMRTSSRFPFQGRGVAPGIAPIATSSVPVRDVPLISVVLSPPTDIPSRKNSAVSLAPRVRVTTRWCHSPSANPMRPSELRIGRVNPLDSLRSSWSGDFW